MQEFTCTTWNILAPEFVKCDYYESVACPRLNVGTRREDIYKHIERLNSDVFILQEVTKEEYKLLEKRFDNYKMKLSLHDAKHWAADSTKKRQRNGNAIMVKKTLKLKKPTKLALSVNGNKGLVAQVKIGKTEITVCSIHLDDISAKTRMSQLKTLLKHTKKSPMLLIGGDFNDPSPTIRNYMTKHHFDSSYDHSTNPTYMEEKDMAIDFVFTRGVKMHNVHIPQTDRQKIIREFGSDHLPVTVHVVVAEQ